MTSRITSLYCIALAAALLVPTASCRTSQQDEFDECLEGRWRLAPDSQEEGLAAFRHSIFSLVVLDIDGGTVRYLAGDDEKQRVGYTVAPRDGRNGTLTFESGAVLDIRLDERCEVAVVREDDEAYELRRAE